MRFLDLDSDSIITTADIFREWKTGHVEDPYNHAEKFSWEMLVIIMDTINGRNNCDIIEATPREIENLIYRLRRVNEEA